MNAVTQSHAPFDRKNGRMMLRGFCPMALLVAMSAALGVAHASPATDQVREAHAAMDRELSSVNNRVNDDWRNYLALDEIEAQLELGENADPKTILNILERYAIDHEVIKKPPYDLGRPAIEVWLAEIVPPADLPGIVAQVAADATLPARPSAEQTLARLRPAVRRMDQYLASRFSKQDQRNWRRYFHWNELSQQLAANQIDVDALAEIARRFQAATPLFRERGDQTVRSTADALTRAAGNLRLLNTTEDELRENLRRLASRLQENLDKPTRATAEAIGEPLGWLRERQLHPALVDMIDQSYRRPNLYLDISHRLAAAGIEFKEDIPYPMDAYINGVRFRGNNHAKSRLDMHWTPNDEQAQVDFRFKSNVGTSASGQQQGVTFRSKGTIYVEGNKHVTIDDGGLDWKPATSAATHESRITNTNADSREIDYVYGNKASTEREVERRAARDARRRLDDDAEQVFGPAQRYLIYNLRIPMMIRNMFPTDLRVRTAADQMMLSATQATPSQLAAKSDPPSVPEEADLSFRLHESIITNAAAALLPARTMNELEIEEFMADYFGFVPQGLKTEEEGPLWSISFADRHPIATQLDDGILTIRLRADRFHVGEKEYPAMQIAARYKLTEDTSGLVGERQGRISILPLDYKEGDRLGARWSTFRTLFRRRFDRVFPEIISLDRFRLGGNWDWVGELEVHSFSAKDGWLALHYQMPDDAVEAIEASDAQ